MNRTELKNVQNIGRKNTNAININEARTWFDNNSLKKTTTEFRNDAKITSLSVTPDWDFATTTKYDGFMDVVIVPIQEKLDQVNLPKITAINLMLFKNGDSEIQSRLLFFVPTPEYVDKHPKSLDIENFSGVTFQVNQEGRMGVGWAIKDGAFLASITFKKQEQGTLRDPDFDFWLGGGPDCFDFDKSRWDRFVESIGNFFKDLFHSDYANKPSHNYDGGDGSNFGNYSYGSPFNEIWGTWSNNNTGGGGGNTIKDYFSDAVLGIKNVKRAFDDECSKGLGNKDVPFLFAAETLHQITSSNSSFESTFATALDYHYQLQQEGINTSLTQVINDMVSPNPTIQMNRKYLFETYPNYPQVLKDIMRKATDAYSKCLISYGIKVKEDNAGVELPNDQACDCLAEFNVELALNEFWKNSFGTSAENGLKILNLKVNLGLNDKQTTALGIILKLYPNLFPAIEELAGNPNFYDDVKEFLTKIYVDPNCINGLELDSPSLNIGQSLSVTNPLCPKSFTFPLNNSIDGLTKGGLKNVAVSFTAPNGTVISVPIAYLYIYIQNDIATLSGSPSALFANAINNATNTIQNQITQGIIPPTIGQFGIKALYMSAIGQSLQTLGLSFAGSSGGSSSSSTIKSDVKFINQVSAAAINTSNGQPAQVVNWNTAITTLGCP